MARTRKAFLDVVTLNQALSKLGPSIGALERDLVMEDQDFLVVSLDVFQSWLKRKQVLGDQDLPAARLRIRGLVDAIEEGLRTEEISAPLRRRLALLGRELLRISR